MIRRPPRSTLFPTRRSSDLNTARRRPHPAPISTRWEPHYISSYRAMIHRIPLFNLPPYNYLVDRKSTRLNSSHLVISYAVFCLKKKNVKNLVSSVAYDDAII